MCDRSSTSTQGGVGAHLRVRVGATRMNQPNPTSTHPSYRERVEPLVHRRVELGTRQAPGRRAATSRRSRPPTASPARRSRRSRRSRTPTRRPAPASPPRPTCSQLPRTAAIPPGARWAAAPRTTSRDSSSPGQAGIAVGEPVRRRDHERGVGHHQVEALIGHGGEERPLTQVQLLLRDPGQRGGEGGRCGQRVGVGGHDPARVARRVQHLGPARSRGPSPARRPGAA